MPQENEVDSVHVARLSRAAAIAVLESLGAMRIIDRYIFRELLSHSLLGLLIFTFVFFVPQLLRLMELIVPHSAAPGSVALLFLSAFPAVLTFTVPMAVLVGVLIGLGRMSADSELIAMNAVGIGLRRILVPVGVLASSGTVLTLVMTLWLGPAAVRTFRALEEGLRATQASLQVQPRVFDERFPHLVLYVEDVAAAGTHWRGVFLAETGAESGSRLTLAEGAIVVADRGQGKLQFHLRNGSTHEYSQGEPNRYSVTTFGESDWPIEIAGTSVSQASTPRNQELSLRALLSQRGRGWREARVELHRRLAFPAACVAFALLAVPLGARPRRGRAGGFLVALALICGYYLVFVTGAGLARQGKLSPAAGIWAANAFVMLLGFALLPRLERIHSSGSVSRAIRGLFSWRGNVQLTPSAQRHAPGVESAENSLWSAPVFAGLSPRRLSLRRATGFPQLMDLYLLRRFLYYFFLVLAAFILLFEAFTFFELLDDITRHRAPFMLVVGYLGYLMPHLVYQLAPLAALVSALVTLGVMTKNNEIVALKASGVSLYRMALPLLSAGFALAGAMLALDDTYLPYANQRQDALRNEIKGRPAQTYFQPRRRWIFGENSKVYNYAFFDPDHAVFGGLSVFELDPSTFQLRRRIYAERARWEARHQTWILESGWVRDLNGSQVQRYIPFLVYALEELKEPPSYFNREVRQYYQLDWRDLRQYIRDLQQAGFDVARLSVQWHKKLAFPLIAPVIVLLAVPFSVLVGTRGAVGGLALGVAIAIVYWGTSALFEALGAVGELPPLMAGWAPDAIFAFVALYFFLKMPT